MSEAVQQFPQRSHAIDWSAALRFFGRQFRRGRYRLPEADAQDLAQEALVRLIRAQRRAPVHRPEPLMARIAERTWIDHLRRRERWHGLVDPGADLEELLPAVVGSSMSSWGDPLERVKSVVLQFLTQHDSPCVELARAYFDREDWTVVARRLNRSETAVRKQWSRCARKLKQAAHARARFDT